MSDSWSDYRQQFSKITLTDLQEHQVLSLTMLANNGRTIIEEFNNIKNDKKWNIWNEILLSSKNFNPVLFDKNKNFSCNSIHLLHHIVAFEKAMNTSLQNVETVYEFGGGFGNFAELFFKYSKCKKYTICDFEELLNVQKTYLKKTVPDCNVVFEPTYNNTEQHELFVSTWALSECNHEVRKSVLPTMLNSKYVLLAYAGWFDGITNDTYFDNIRKMGTHEWIGYTIPSLDGNSKYLFGVKN